MIIRIVPLVAVPPLEISVLTFVAKACTYWLLKSHAYRISSACIPAQAKSGARLDITGLETLTEREKEVLRLLARGFEVKTAAQQLGITANTANERLREARRKLRASNSRHAARLLAQSEMTDPKKSGDRFVGIVTEVSEAPQARQPHVEAEEGLGTAPTLNQSRPAYAVAGEAFGKLPYLPLRQRGEKGNFFSRSQRLVAIAELSIKLIAVVAIVCLVAVLLNSLIETR